MVKARKPYFQQIFDCERNFNIDEYVYEVGEWHRSSSGLQLHEYLGLTWEEWSAINGDKYGINRLLRDKTRKLDSLYMEGLNLSQYDGSLDDLIDKLILLKEIYSSEFKDLHFRFTPDYDMSVVQLYGFKKK